LLRPGFFLRTLARRRFLVFFLFVGLLLPACRTKEPVSREKRPATRSSSAEPRGTSSARLAIIIDDLGYDPAAARAVLDLRFPLTLAVIPHTPFSRGIAEEAHRRGAPVMLHLPMESANGDARSEAIELKSGMDSAEMERIVAGMLKTVPYAIGVNNHQGSLATTDPALLTSLMSVLRERQLFFIDSRTSSGSRAYAVARRAGVPASYRNVFLDDVQTREATLQQLQLAVDEALRDGQAIAIGHPHPTTIEVLREFLPRLSSRGVRLVFVSDLVR